MVGIVSYGSYIPYNRLSVEEIAAAWGKNPQEIISSLGVSQKSVAAIDEDAVTLAVTAGLRAVQQSNIDPKQIGAMFVGSESHPYAVNPSSTIIGEYLGFSHNYLAADFQFACKAGSAGIQAVAGLVESGQIEYGMAIGTDTAQSMPHDALEYASASAAVSLVVGSVETSSVIAKLRNYTSYSSDTPDFWRRDGIRYPSHAGRFTGEPAYFTHVIGAAQALLTQSGVSVAEIDHCVFHMPNGKFPRDVAKRLGFTPQQGSTSLTVDHIGNPYSASSLLGLASVLDVAKVGELIFMVSYGSGAGSDAFLWEITSEIEKYRQHTKKAATIREQLQQTKSISYVQYLKQTHKI